MVNKRVQNAVAGYNLKNYRMSSVRLQGKPFNITVIQVYAPICIDDRGAIKVTFLNASKSKTAWGNICHLSACAQP